VIYRGSKPNPALGRNFEALPPLEWLARMADHIPDAGKHRTLFYGHYANRVCGARSTRPADPASQDAESEDTRKRRCTRSWARLIARVHQADPLTCRKCGAKLTLVAYFTDGVSIRRILDHLGLSTAPQDRTPPHEPPDIVRVPVDDEGRELPAS
jgi:hypothetical protein